MKVEEHNIKRLHSGFKGLLKHLGTVGVLAIGLSQPTPMPAQPYAYVVNSTSFAPAPSAETNS
jgi:hypothetical protein